MVAMFIQQYDNWACFTVMYMLAFNEAELILTVCELGCEVSHFPNPQLSPGLISWLHLSLAPQTSFCQLRQCAIEAAWNYVSGCGCAV